MNTVDRDAPATPRKTPRSAVKRTMQQRVPTPNPPLVPFPTPPSSRKRQRRLPPFSSPSSLLLSDLPPQPAAEKAAILPPHLETLLILHKALTLALTLHLAQSPPVLPKHSSAAKEIALENLTSLVQIKAIVERTAARRFGVQELRRLAFIWAWDGESLSSSSTSATAQENPFLATATSSKTSTSPIEPLRALLSFLITPLQALSPISNRPVWTYGLGINLSIHPGETRFVQGTDGVLSGGKGGIGGGIGAVGRWSSEASARELVFRERLERWVELHKLDESQPNPQLPTPSENLKDTLSIPQIPLYALPPLPTTGGLGQGTLASALEIKSSPKKQGLFTVPPLPPFGLGDGEGEGEDVFGKEVLVKGNVVRSGTVEERRQAMRDRIAARSGSASMPGTPSKPRPSNMSTADLQSELQRRSTLSRLEGVAESVWMLFTAPDASTPVSSSPQAKTRRRTRLLSDVASVVVQSSKTPISIAEAQSSLTLLTQLCPSFLISRQVAKQDWLEMPANAPPSPASSVPASGPIAVGPASPGRVARAGRGGLREVREQIRRQLDGF